MESPKQILIVGGGLAGALLAAESVRAGHRVSLVDAENPGAATHVAAGLYNIITGRMASKTWKAEEFLAALDALFEADLLQPLKRFLHPKTIYRPYKSISERNEWFLKSAEPSYAHLVRHQGEALHPSLVHNSLGGLEILPCGWLEAGSFTTALKAQLAMTGRLEYIQEIFDYASLDPETLGLELRGEERQFEEVVFAEGTGVLQNPFFSWVDIRPLKGQVLEIEMEGLPEDFVLLRKAYLVPREKGRYVVGSTYEKKFSDLLPTKEGVESLSNMLAEATPLPFRIVEARAGARPTTPNRRPVMGRHPQYPGLAIFNGLGTKGVLQGPWCAGEFRKWLDGKTPQLPPDLSLKRFG